MKFRSNLRPSPARAPAAGDICPLTCRARLSYRRAAELLVADRLDAASVPLLRADAPRRGQCAAAAADGQESAPQPAHAAALRASGPGRRRRADSRARPRAPPLTTVAAEVAGGGELLTAGFRSVVPHGPDTQKTPIARPYLTEKYEAYRAWGQDAVLPQDETFDLPFDRLLRERFVIGTPGSCWLSGTLRLWLTQGCGLKGCHFHTKGAFSWRVSDRQPPTPSRHAAARTPLNERLPMSSPALRLVRCRAAHR